MSKSSKVTESYFLLLLPLLIIIIIFSYLYKARYINCLLKDFSLCINSKFYMSVNKQFSFRYPQDYPLTFASEDDLNKSGWNGKWAEWVNFSAEFYPNAGGDRLGDVIVEKNTPYSNVNEYANKELTKFEIPPKIEYVKIGGKEAVCSSLQPQPHSFNSPSYDCYIIYKGELYRISFDYNSYYHKLPIQYYEKAKQIILSTFSFN